MAKINYDKAKETIQGKKSATSAGMSGIVGLDALASVASKITGEMVKTAWEDTKKKQAEELAASMGNGINGLNTLQESATGNISTTKKVTKIEYDNESSINDTFFKSPEDISFFINAGEEIASARENFDASLDNILNHRHKLYENLVSFLIAKYYADKISKSTESMIGCINIYNSSNTEKNTEISDIMSSMASALPFITNDVPTKEKLDSLIGSQLEYFTEMFNDLIEATENSHITLTKDGIGLSDNTLVAANDYISTVLVPYENEAPASLVTANKFKIDVTTLNDISIEDGSQDYPFLIKTDDDLNGYLSNNNNNNIYYRLCNNFIIKDMDNITFYGNLDGNGYIITTSALNIDVKGSLTNINLEFVKSASATLKKIKFKVSNANGLSNARIFLTSNNIDITKKDDIVLILTDKNVRIYNQGNLFNRSISYNKGDLTCTEVLDSESKVCYILLGNAEDGSEEDDTISFPVYKTTAKEGTHTVSDTISAGTSLLSCNVSLVEKNNSEKSFKSEDGNLAITIYTTNDLIKEDIPEFNLKITCLKSNIDGSTIDISNSKYFKKNLSSTKMFNIIHNELNILSLIKSVADIAAYKLYTQNDLDSEKYKEQGSFKKEIYSKFSKLKYDLKNASETIKAIIVQKSEYLLNLTKSFETIESIRMNNSSTYDASYSTNLITNFTTIKNYSSVFNINMGEYTASFEDSIVSIVGAIESLKLDIDSVIPTLCSNILDINDIFNNYILLHNLKNSYGTNLKNLAVLMSEIMTGKFTDYNGSIIRPDNLRLFEDWYTKFKLYSNDGLAVAAQMYIVQEMGINLLNYFISDSNSINNALKSIVSSFTETMIRRGLLIDPKCNIITTDEYNIEKELFEKNIIIDSDSTISNIHPNILNISSIFDPINNLDLTNLMLKLSLSNEGTSTVSSDEIILTQSKECALIRILLIKYILSGSSLSIEEKLDMINKALQSCEKNLKTILFEYEFRRLLKDITEIIDEDNLVIDDESKKYEITSLNKSLDIFKNAESNYNKFVTDILKKYILVWEFRYYSTYSPAGSMLYFLKIKELDSTTNKYKYTEYKDFREFLYRTISMGEITSTGGVNKVVYAVRTAIIKIYKTLSTIF